MGLLDQIEYPTDLKKLDKPQLIQLADELREFIIDEVSANPGHFGASLGAVELTVALHYVYNTPYDRLIWDVGHQAYGHKILTGRKNRFQTNRKLGGISGFPNRSESEYDAFGVGHSSTSISAALGMAVSAQLRKEDDRHVIAVIGDGALTGGMAMEGLNNVGVQNANILVVLNDNDMAIDPNVGAFKEYLTDIATSRPYNKLKDEVWNMLGKFNRLGPTAQRLIQKVDNSIKSLLMKQSNFFEAINFRYFGPIDGHDVVHLVNVMNDLKDIPGPKLLHCITKKGKGFKQAELNAAEWHAPGKFDKNTGLKIKDDDGTPKPPKYQDVFGHTLLELARQNKEIVGITPAMPAGSSLNIMMKEMPDRCFDVGIAEQHAVTFSAGLAAEQKTPFCNIYSTFMQRAYDQIVHDVALQQLPVVFCLDRGGLVGEDGATHHGAFDMAYMRSVPNMIVSAPMNETELRNLMYTAQNYKEGPFSIRYPRGRGMLIDWKQPMNDLPIGQGRKVSDGEEVAIVSIGHPGNFVQQAINHLKSENITPAHYDIRFLRPIDEDLLEEVFNKFQKIITVEDGTIIGGLGSAVIEYAAEHGHRAQIVRLGIPDKFIEHGKPAELYRMCGFDAAGIVKTVKEIVSA
ncbi:MAG TPA: 1-deoxy-D-xylulose-5-phosphate synthase [Salinivirga sp.]|uniref:1-deoxy-D-xylulose-5-phosphate synthase n=1 Tax=Salinivirga sp. TaxID=1970192 RepID=UPI002B476168|nr:1-deoxy-D-xylulose-5-phosphate synthase [Salinivirga sp.]HKK59120.1 1-deoxy-D-xylulose-5-phosphate synthase [Salinivirga sp.]